FLLRPRRPASSTLFPYTTLFRSRLKERRDARGLLGGERLTLVLVAHVLVVLALVGGGTLAGNLSAAAVSGLADVRYPIHHDFLGGLGCRLGRPVPIRQIVGKVARVGRHESRRERADLDTGGGRDRAGD